MNARSKVNLYRRLLRKAEAQRRRTAAPLDQAIEDLASDVGELRSFVQRARDTGQGPATDLIEYELAARNLQSAHDQLMLAYDAVVPRHASARMAAVHTIEGPASDNIQKALRLLYDVKAEARLRHWDPEIASLAWTVINQTEYLLELVEAAETTPRTFGAGVEEKPMNTRSKVQLYRRLLRKAEAELREAALDRSPPYPPAPTFDKPVSRWSRRELQEYLEDRGFAVYSDESIRELRETVQEDLESGY